MKRKHILSILLLLTLIAALTACGTKTEAIRIGSKDFTENLIVGEIYALALEDAGYPVERKFNIASSVVHTAILNDEIDLYPEYTGTGLLTVLKMDPITDPDEMYRTVQEEYNKQFNLIWLSCSRANDGQGLVIRTELAEELGIRTISDLQVQADKIRFASQGEFDQRDDGIPGLEKVYGPFQFQSSRAYDNGLKYQVLESGEADVVPAYTTEGPLVNTDRFTLLEDDKQMWPPYYLAPVVRNPILEANPGIADALDRVNIALDTKTITALNAQVDVEKREYEEVAAEFWRTLE